MSKSRVCAERTVNLAKQACARKTNLLVYERQKGEGCSRPQPKTYIPRKNSFSQQLGKLKYNYE
jgi:hypothetical protein